MNVIAVDVMGGDVAPGPQVAGAVAAVREHNVSVVLVGDDAAIAVELARQEMPSGMDQIRVQPASEVVTMDDNPSTAFRHKKNSSLRVAMELVASGEADAFVSAGNSGAVLAHSLFILKRLPHVVRPGIVAVFPRPSGRPLVLCDMGANVEAKPAMLAQFGVLGAHYGRILHGPGGPKPRVAVLSNGTEPSKGTALTRAASALLEKVAAHPESELEYVGYVEGSAIFDGDIDVVATDGFTGNVVLKVTEGASAAVMKMVKVSLESSLRARLGARLIEPALTEVIEDIDPSEFGGALLVGVGGVVVIAHGKSDSTAMTNAILEANRFANAGLIGKLARAVERHHNLWNQSEEIAS